MVSQTAQTGAGCPFSSRATNFDPFGPAFQADPAEALRWSRDAEPVFFSEPLGYWVVSRYDDIKAIFRDNITFSPAIALEKITPPTPEALAVLKREGYAMDRTLVNEDEPAHMARRRVLMDAFAPEALARHAPMVRRLVRDKLDAIIDRGHSDLVADMLWDVPLTVALRFLGVPAGRHGHAAPLCRGAYGEHLGAPVARTTGRRGGRGIAVLELRGRRAGTDVGAGRCRHARPRLDV